MLKFKILTTCLLLSCCAPIGVAQEDDPFRSQVRPTKPLTPAEQQKTFQLPPGFQIELVAADPEILKPMNLAFDVRGRLWVSMSQEYPYAAPEERQPQDCIKIFEDTTGDGNFDEITMFAEGLNIPIGLYPYKNGVIAWSIPNIWFLQDTNGDGRADKRTKLFGPMGYERDTHGMNNGFTRGFDGWMYACHGFNNETSVTGADGHNIKMHSGNTYRIRTDGSRIEHFTHGQVNPFGMTQDARGNLYTADCHSKPIYQLIEGGYYPSFGKPHDGLGYVPPMMSHLHDSTAIAGVAIHEDDLFPEEFRGDMFSGNVMTSRINRNRLEYHGSTVKAVEQPDFLTTTDPWFRPVDVVLGPDGALYIADFYNRIIGHYEVPLDHPGRDRTSGRIWKISYKESNHAQRLHSQQRITQQPLNKLVEELGHPNLTRRMLVTDYLSDTVGESAIPELLKTVSQHEDSTAVAHALWVLFRLKATDSLNFAMLLKHPSALVRLHATKLLHELPSPSASAIIACEYLLNDQDAFVRRAAIETLGRHAEAKGDLEELLLRSLESIPIDDVILRHTTRMALRDIFTRDSDFASHQSPSLNNANRAKQIAEITLGMKTESAGRYLIEYLKVFPAETNHNPEFLQQIVNTVPADLLPEIVGLIRGQFEEEWEQQLPLLYSIRETLGESRALKSRELTQWADELFEILKESSTQLQTSWTSTHPERDPWNLQSRPCADGQTAELISSHPHGEQLTGSLTSKPFPAPSHFSFYLCGHRGFPAKEPHNLNLVTLRDAATDAVLRSSYPPRNDTAQKVVWNLQDLDGRKVYLQATDGDTAGAYAWLAFGRIEPSIISVPTFPPAYQQAMLIHLAQLKKLFKLTDRQEAISHFLQKGNTSHNAQQQLASAYLQQQNRPLLESLAELLISPALPKIVRSQLIQAITEHSEFDPKQLSALVKQLPSEVQEQLILSFTNTETGRKHLFELLESGDLSARLMQRQAVASKLNIVASASQKETIARLTKNLPDVSAELKALISSRLQEYPNHSPTIEQGRLIFEKHCQNCHQIGGKGELVGPQLDGIGNRGKARLFEDTLDPNQNVDVAFHTMTIITTEGKVVTGLFRRKEGDQWILADVKGKEFSIPAESIEESRKSPLSLMPENIARELPPQDFYALMKYLLEQTAPLSPPQ